MAFQSTSTLLLLLLMACLGMVVVVPLVLGAPPTCPPGELEAKWHQDPENCSAFYMCHMGRLYSFGCSADTVWSPAVMTCVGRNSRLDTCTLTSELHSLNNAGSNCMSSKDGVFPKMDNCAQYYDCGSKEGIVTGDPHVMECPYPALFDPETSQCLHYNSVTCGSRPEPKDACEYEANQCKRSHCIPCNVRHPTCKGQPDGLNPWIGKEYSPYYVVCENGRAVYDGSCDSSNGPQIFHPEKRLCVMMNE